MDICEPRFWNKVLKTDGCWLWTGCTRPYGYGKLTSNRKTAFAHRVSYELAYGSIPAGMFVLHRCDVRNCVRPDHLWLGTAADNSADMIRKGRATMGPKSQWATRPETRTIGERNFAAKLTAAQVVAMRARHAQGNISFEKLGQEFGVSSTNAHIIITGKTWRHLLPTPV